MEHSNAHRGMSLACMGNHQEPESHQGLDRHLGMAHEGMAIHAMTNEGMGHLANGHPSKGGHGAGVQELACLTPGSLGDRLSQMRDAQKQSPPRMHHPAESGAGPKCTMSIWSSKLRHLSNGIRFGWCEGHNVCTTRGSELCVSKSYMNKSCVNFMLSSRLNGAWLFLAGSVHECSYAGARVFIRFVV